MFDSVEITQFIYGKELGEKVSNLMLSSFPEMSKSEIDQKVKCVLSSLQKSKPAMGTYYLQAYLRELLVIVQTLSKNDSSITTQLDELPKISTIPVSETELVNTYLSSLNELLKVSLNANDINTFDKSKLVIR